MIPIEEHEKRMALYRQGLTDQQIACRLYLTTAAIWHWRRANGLPANHKRDRIDWSVADEMINDHVPARDIANAVGCSTSTVWQRIRKIRGPSWHCRR